MELHKHVFIIVGLHSFCAKMDDDQTIRTIKWIYYEYIRSVFEIFFTNRDAESHIVICYRSEY